MALNSSDVAAWQDAEASQYNDLREDVINTYSDMVWELRMWSTDTPPTVAIWSWLICDGSAISRTTYSDLFAVIGTDYWVWNWSTTFNIPDLTGKVPVGKDSGTFTPLWDTWGEEEHTLITAEIPAHTHNSRNWVNWWGTFPSASTADFDSNLATTSTGWDGAHNNLQPYLVINYIIKA